MHRTLFFLAHTVAVAGLVALEFAPNEYLANAFVLVKTVIALEATMAWTLIGTFATKLPSPATINNAIRFSRSEKRTRWQQAANYAAKVQSWLIVVLALVFGQWFVMLVTLLFIAGMATVKSSAEKYLRGMKIDFDKKSAVIDV